MGLNLQTSAILDRLGYGSGTDGSEEPVNQPDQNLAIMNLRHLKPLRVCIALVFFLPTAFLFLDLRDTGIRSFAGEVLFLQFVPSMLKFLNQTATGLAGIVTAVFAGFIVVLILTMMFGRVYCSTICPLGTFQDLISRLGRRKKLKGKKPIKHHRYDFSEPHSIIRYAFLFLTILFFLAGSGFLLNLLDPFSSFGRIVSNLFRPLALALNNLGFPWQREWEATPFTGCPGRLLPRYPWVYHSPC
ncbi:MAG: 4Fe-4S binding protein [Desulfobacterium sp.]|nr:4Fe-4S binding protein [Desulfobacterium sp.]